MWAIFARSTSAIYWGAIRCRRRPACSMRASATGWSWSRARAARSDRSCAGRSLAWARSGWSCSKCPNSRSTTSSASCAPLRSKNSLHVELVGLIGNAHHKLRMREILLAYRVQTVYHAAAYKHVPIVEQNVIEGIYNNVISTWYAAEAAHETEVETFVLVSTDKAVNPTNVMGATKRFAEIVLQGLHQRGSKTRFCMVRFGNVLASSGSVVPLFNEQIKAGGPVTVTHPEVIRYFMTIPEAAQLVIQAGSMADGGDVFVLDMGKPVRICDLARRMIHLMGLTVRDEQHPDGDIEIAYTGLRPAEKLYEELLIGNNVTGTQHPDDPSRHRAFPAVGAGARHAGRDPGGHGPLRLPAFAAAVERCRRGVQAGARIA